MEIDLARWRRNLRAIAAELRPGVRFGYVIKEEANGHGLLTAAELAAEAGVSALIVGSLDEAVRLRGAGWRRDVLLLGRCHPEEMRTCVEERITACVHAADEIAEWAETARRAGGEALVHLEINTGLNRYGAHWSAAVGVAEACASAAGVRLGGVFTHFAQSDEADKTFARVQIARFEEVLAALRARGIPAGVRHACNSGGFLDLPEAHYDMVRVGLLPCGVFPSDVCRRIAGIEPVMSVRARIAMIQELRPGDHAGYGMRFTATRPTRIAILPIGYGDGYPRMRNAGRALVRGRSVPIVGGVSTGAVFLDVTDVPDVRLWDVATLLGDDGQERITATELARLAATVNYDVLLRWRAKLPRVLVSS
ncbi:alanine racemase [Oleiharenicola sp. Vm1]|uniref:alanine racemase n=1 Tax=Oleiharenicola sp. Vm1 TaxID=3398393 RepID=UPI0039F49C31